MPTKPEILDAALEVLRRGEPLTIDAVARESGLTKPGVVHHFATKDTLTFGIVGRVIDRWADDLCRYLGDREDPVDRLRAYVDHAFTHDFDPSDLALLADIRLRESMARQWNERLEPWLCLDYEGPVDRRAALRAARLMADGAWINRSLGIRAWNESETPAIRSLAMALLEGTGTR